ncbi:nucleoside transporter-domain-containing protein [Pelagophyceae sp. CCMP2097]|nr:nucleoside transporter-domain-containing protein [Pelagophyceae sp. CCMP2097]
MEVPGERLTAALALATIGCSSLFAWNALITNSNYYAARFCGSGLARNFEAVFSVTYQATSLLATLAALRGASLSPATRVVACQVALAALFAGFTLLAWCDTIPRDIVFVPATLIGVGLCGMLSQVLCSASYGIAAMLPPRCMSAMMSGQALGGLVPALILVASDLTQGAPPAADDANACDVSPALTSNAVGYFATATVLYVCSVAAFRALERTALYREAVGDVGVAPVVTAEYNPINLDGDHLLLEPSAVKKRALVAEVVGISRAIAVPALAIVAVFGVTLSTFPTLTALSRLEGHADDDGGGSRLARLYVPLLFLLFNAGDFVGRVAASFVPSWVERPRCLLAAALLRIGFVPLLALGTLSGSRLHPRGAAWLRSSAAACAVNAAFSVSNGLAATLTMGAAAPLVAPHQRELAGNLMSLFLTVGLNVGSVMSFAVLAVVQ